jgi:hypothetical protein
MTPADALAMLDSQLAEHGETIVLRRLTLGPGGTQIPFSVNCLAFVRGYEPEQLVGGITQQDSRVILSPTQIVAAGWTSGRGPTEDRRIPMKNNQAVVQGRAKNVEAAVGKYLNGELVRIEMQVRG